jgi:enoyl-CoA hydratase
MNFKTVILSQKGPLAFLTLNRPEKANRLDPQMSAELVKACQEINYEKDIAVVIITGAGDQAFCCGEDIELFAPLSEKTFVQFKEFILSNQAFQSVASIECPVIAAINGDALGAGLALALSSDLRIASEQASFGVPDLTQGYFFPNGITQLLPRIVGRGKALEMILTAEPIDAAEAMRIGLVHQLAPHHQVLAEAEKMAQEIASKAPIALRYAKEAIHKGLELTLAQGLRLEADLYMLLQTTQDRTEGVKSFLEKRSPHFKGE